MAEVEKKRFHFEFISTDNIEADSLNQALKLFLEKHPGHKPNDVRHIVKEAQNMAWVRSRHTGVRIWYEPGCACGFGDCVHDPVRKAAENCIQQSEMELNKWESCPYANLDGCNCSNYFDK